MSEIKKEKKSHYVSGAESRRIAKENAKATRYYEKQKKRKIKEEEFVTEMNDSGNIIEFDDLHTYFFTDAGVVKAVDGVTFSIPEGATVGVVGESGCGKSTLVKIMAGCLKPQKGVVLWNGYAMEDIDDLSQDFAFCKPYESPERTKHLIQEFLGSGQLSTVQNS